MMLVVTMSSAVRNTPDYRLVGKKGFITAGILKYYNIKYILLLLLFTAIELSLAGSSPYTGNKEQ
jgi:hypothetical protein